MVPVVKHAEALDLWGSAAEIGRLSEAARSGMAARDELTGSTITITSLGAMGGVATTPIINHPEVAIVGVNKIMVRPVWDGSTFVPKRMMNLSSSFDHRVVDGWDRSEEHTSELQSRQYLVCRLLLEKKKTVQQVTGTGKHTCII